MKNFFIPHNLKALNLIKEWSDEIFSFLGSKPDTDKIYNHIWTVNNKERSENNGYSNFKFQYNEYYNDNAAIVQRINVRIETLFKKQFCIPARKIHNYRKADYLIFGDSDELYISQDHSWLENKAYQNRYDIDINGKLKTYFKYNLDILLNDGHIIELQHGNKYKTGYMPIITDSFKNAWEKSGRPVIEKQFQNYNIDLSKIKIVQFDAKTAQSCYYGLKGSKTTDLLGTLVKITTYYADYSTVSASAIYQKLSRSLNKVIESGELSPCYIPLRSDHQLDPDTTNENNELVLYLSQTPDLNIQENLHHNKTENMKDYQKNYGNMYRKIKKYKQTHTEPKASWTDEEKELFRKL